MAAFLDLVLSPYLILRSFLRRRLPKDDEVDRVLIVGSATDKVVRKVLDVAAARYPKAQFSAFVDHADVDAYRHLWPRMQFAPIDSSENVASPFKVVRLFRSERYTLGALVLSGEPGFWRRKVLGLLSGARYLAVYNENADSLYWNIWDAGLIAAHLWHRTGFGWETAASTAASSAVVGGRARLGIVSLPLAYGLHFGNSLARFLRVFSIPLGYFVILARAAPLLLSGLTHRD